jgi:hypothetical protein
VAETGEEVRRTTEVGMGRRVANPGAERAAVVGVEVEVEVEVEEEVEVGEEEVGEEEEVGVGLWTVPGTARGCGLPSRAGAPSSGRGG